jgi:hypothetical protein
MLLDSLKTIAFGNNYNRILGKNVLPSSLRILTVGDSYNQILGEIVLLNSFQPLNF